jgi:hypothetical protein
MIVVETLPINHLGVDELTNIITINCCNVDDGATWSERWPVEPLHSAKKNIGVSYSVVVERPVCRSYHATTIRRY